MSLGLFRWRGMKLQWHERMKAGVAVVSFSLRAEILEVSLQIPPFSLSFCPPLPHRSTQHRSFPAPCCSFPAFVNPVINHPVTVTELLLIAISRLPCLIVFVP